MLRITDQYFWNFIFLAFFVCLVVMAMIILNTEARITLGELTITDFVLMTLATWRLTRFFVYDHITKFIREQWLDPVKTKEGLELVKPKNGPRRTLADLSTCPWCMGIWMAATVSFFYLLTPIAFYPVLFLAMSAVATYLQLLSNLTGNRADQLKNQNERGY